MKKERFYKNAEQNAAFNRCIDVMTRLIQKYGSAILEEMKRVNGPIEISHHKRSRNRKYLQSYFKYISLHEKNDAA